MEFCSILRNGRPNARDYFDRTVRRPRSTATIFGLTAGIPLRKEPSCSFSAATRRSSTTRPSTLLRNVCSWKTSFGRPRSTSALLLRKLQSAGEQEGTNHQPSPQGPTSFFRFGTLVGTSPQRLFLRARFRLRRLCFPLPQLQPLFPHPNLAHTRIVRTPISRWNAKPFSHTRNPGPRTSILPWHHLHAAWPPCAPSIAWYGRPWSLTTVTPRLFGNGTLASPIQKATRSSMPTPDL